MDCSGYWSDVAPITPQAPCTVLPGLSMNAVVVKTVKSWLKDQYQLQYYMTWLLVQGHNGLFNSTLGL